MSVSRSKSKQKTLLANITCGWKDCVQSFENVLKLNDHLRDHIDAHKTKRYNQKCPWRDCDFMTKSVEHKSRHIYYHGYFAGLLAQGELELSTQNLPACKAKVRTDFIPLLERDFKCEWQDCECIYESIVEFQEHIVQHVCFEYEFRNGCVDMPQKVECRWNYCRKEFNIKYRMVDHVRTHTNKKSVACTHCFELFRTKVTLFDHLRRQPDSDTEQKFPCAKCFKYFVTEKLLRVHLLKHVNCHKCSMCDMTCSSLSSLAVHVRYRHLRDKPFKCNECNYRCVRKGDLQKHINFVHEKKYLHCDRPGCNYTVKSANLIRRHLLEIHGDCPFIYMCHCCDKAYKSGKTLSQHLMKQHDYPLPSGHKRFKYRLDENGYYRLETMRIESLEVSKQILSTPSSSSATKVNILADSEIDQIDATTEDSNWETFSITTTHDDSRILSFTADFSDFQTKSRATEQVSSLPALD